MQYYPPTFSRQPSGVDSQSNQSNIFTLLGMILEQRQTNVQNAKIPEQIIQCFPFLKDNHQSNFNINIFYNGMKIDLNIKNASVGTITPRATPQVAPRYYSNPTYPQIRQPIHPSANQYLPYVAPQPNVPQFIEPLIQVATVQSANQILAQDASVQSRVILSQSIEVPQEREIPVIQQKISVPSEPIYPHYTAPRRAISQPSDFQDSESNPNGEDSEDEGEYDSQDEFGMNHGGDSINTHNRQQKIKKLKNGISLIVLINERKKNFLKDFSEDQIRGNLCKLLGEVKEVSQRKNPKAPASFDWKPLGEQTLGRTYDYREEPKYNFDKLVSNQIHLIREHWIKNPNCSIYVFKKRVYLKTSFDEIVNYDEIELSKRRLGKKLNKY